MKHRFSSLCLSLLLVGTLSAQQHDVLLQILRQELDYSMQELQKQEVKPYFMNLRATDSYQTEVNSSFGAIKKSEEPIHHRVVVPQIRVGSMAFDNYKYSNGLSLSGANPLPLDDSHPEAIRQLIWKSIDLKYRNACNDYSRNKEKAKTRTEDEDKAPCFSTAPKETYFEPALPAERLTIDRQEWEKRLNAVSAIFKSQPDLTEGSATISYDAVRTYVVNTEGTEVVQNRASARIFLSVSVKADDGMELPLYESFFAYDPKDLPSDDVLRQAARNLIERLQALKKAPVADPFTGPALLSGPASGVFFHEIFGHRLEGSHLKEGGQTFKKMVGQKVLPASFQVYCDPTLSKYAGADLNGHYLYDDEGVKARRVNNVVNGVLREFLMSRMPIDSFPQSNGHGRTAMAGGDPVSRQSNLVVETAHPYSDAELRHMLVAEAKKQKTEYGYYFKTVTGGFTYTGEGGDINSFNVQPIEVYRVFVDGRPDQLVRGVDIIGTPLAMFSNIEAAGNEPSTFTGMCGAASGWIPVSATSPVIYVSKLETQRRKQSREKPILLPAPEVTNRKGEPQDSIIFAAMHDEMARSKQLLGVDQDPRPFYYSYSTSRKNGFYISATLGGVVLASYTPETTGNAMLAMGDYKRMAEGVSKSGFTGRLPQEVDYDAYRREFWEATDALYKNHFATAGRRKAQLASRPLSPEQEAVADMQPLPPVTYIAEPGTPFVVDREALEGLASRVSAEMLKYPQFYDSGVTLRGVDQTVYRVTTEGQKLKENQCYVQLLVEAKIQNATGGVITDSKEFMARDASELPPAEAICREVDDMATNLLALSKAPLQKEQYSGPLMISGGSMERAFVYGSLREGKLNTCDSYFGSSNTWTDKMGRRVLDKRLVVKDCPAMQTYEGQTLLGHYAVDADGVRPADELTLIDKGVLTARLTGRYPSKGQPASNGHDRFTTNDGQQESASVTVVQPIETVSQAKMKKQLIKAAKAEGLDYAYDLRVSPFGGKRYSYRIDVRTGDETLVNTGDITTEIDDVSWQKNFIGCFSNRQLTFNYLYNNIPCSLICPSSMIMNEMEMQPATTQMGKLPVIPSPLQRNAKADN
jgi:predicted Zn-dependent protease